MYKAIIFDFWGVICKDLYWNWLAKNVQNFHMPEVQSYFTGLATQVDRGEIGSEEFYDTVAEQTGTTPQQILIDWKNDLVLNRELVELIKLLKKNYKTAILSNSNDIIDRVLEDNQIAQFFDEIIVSYKVKLVKPQAEIFELTLNKLGVSAAETIYTDDRDPNVNAAEALGMKGIVFTDTDDFKKHLAALGVSF